MPAAAGGTTDIAARVLAERMGKDLGTAIVVENKGGGGGSIGTAQVARAKPDGHTLLMGNIGPVAINFSRCDAEGPADCAADGRGGACESVATTD